MTMQGPLQKEFWKKNLLKIFKPFLLSYVELKYCRPEKTWHLILLAVPQKQWGTWDYNW